MDHCIALYRKEQKDLQYKVYVTDALKIMVENTAKLYGGSVLKDRFYDIIEEEKKPVKTQKTKEEVIANIRNKLKNF